MNGLFWLASYPKSGNTWARLLIQSLKKGGASININFEDDRPEGVAPRADFDRKLGVDSSDLSCDEVEAARPYLYEIMAEEGRITLPLKVHDAWVRTRAGDLLFPCKATAGAIYIARDPRDVAVSLAHHLGISIDQAIAMMADASTRFGQTQDTHYGLQLRQRLLTWSEHVISWLNAPVPLHFMRYEDMLSDPHTCFGQLAVFLGWSSTSDALARAIESTAFSELQRQEQVSDFIERSPVATSFFRRGIAEGWRDSLTSAQVGKIKEDHGAVMEKLGYI